MMGQHLSIDEEKFAPILAENQRLKIELSDLRGLLMKSLSNHALDIVRLQRQAQEIENLNLDLAWAVRDAEI